jgi:putative spermidine/putrescine transport system substrate-binding protein
MNWILSDEGQALIARFIGGGPVIAEVKLEPKLAAEVPYGKEFALGIYVTNMDMVVRNRASWLEQWAKQMER